MSGKSKITWTERTWEPVLGCSPVSAGCANCYAERLTWRLSSNPVCGERYVGLVRPPMATGRPRWTGVVRFDETTLQQPLSWRKPSKIFVCSRSDLFHESVPDEWIDRVLAIVAQCPQHTFQVLTKRAARMCEYITTRERAVGGTVVGARLMTPASDRRPADLDWRWPLPNVWVGVTCEDQRAADERIPHLLATPAAVRWVSVEPMLGPVDLDCRPESGCPRGWLDETHGIDWVVVGGESGPRARPCDVAWIRSVIDQCRSSAVSCFVKQLGSRPTLNGYDPRRGDHQPLLSGVRHRSGADPSEWPVDLRIREYPEELEVGHG